MIQIQFPIEKLKGSFEIRHLEVCQMPDLNNKTDMKRFVFFISTFSSMYFCVDVMAINVAIFSDPPKTEVRAYYENVFKAENHIMQNEVDSALMCYNIAESMNIRMMIDIRNISVCLSRSDNDDVKISLFKTRYSQTNDTVTISQFISWVSSFLSDEGVEHLRTQLENIKKQNSVDNIDYQELIEKLESMGKDDQLFRGESSFSKAELRQRKKIDSRNMRKLMKLYSDYGKFLTYRLFGGGFSGYEIILIHNFFDKKKYLKYNDFFIGEILAGRLDAREYAGIVDNYRFDSTQVYGCHTVFSVGDSLVVFQLSDSGKRKINSNRKSVFLQDIDVMQNKMIWQWRNFDSFWFENVWELIPAFSNETATDVAKQKLKEMGSIVTGYEILSR